MNITQYTVSELRDPTGILTGKRYEFHLFLEFEEEDELLEEDAAGIRTIYVVDGEVDKIMASYFFKKGTEQALDFELEEEEIQEVLAFCRENAEKVEETSNNQ
ncbi:MULTISPECIES: DUF6509 family protein [unclassified Sporosarcina]|uniref:DUF6509 family protein n=1 Tax=unclassified Sporosarcina TaxID=2647733 RepID=UPI00057A599F|nr:DUF6509 family protein [Sporosarcina sp. ZBG7A]VDG99547.1 Uncharacterised protein [Lysinibacillus sphaericus]